VKPWFHLAYPNWEPQFEINGGSKIVTVPKNAKTDRTIAIEPGLNLWFQKGIGTLLRRKLRFCGVDLDDQSHNQKRCRIASKFNNLATVDFSSASDTISQAIVEYLLPVKWYHLLDACRSAYGTLDDSIIYFEKFSSMGNGFTFELESLIFYSIAVATCNRLGVDSTGISVYGDDVILPSAAFDTYSSVCADLGFTVNKAKSYSSSYYRESCGSHYWNGYDIKPVFQKEPLRGKTAILLAANNIRRFAHRRNTFGCDRAFLLCWKTLLGILGVKPPYIPEGYGDVGLVVNFDETDGSVRRAFPSRQWEGFHTKVWAVQPIQKWFDSHGLLLTKLQRQGKSIVIDNYLEQRITEAAGIGQECPLPGRIRHARKRMLVPVWRDLGPWVISDLVA